MPLKWKREAANAQKKQQNEKLAAAEMTSSAGRKGGGVDTGPKGWVASGKFYESILLKPGVCALGALQRGSSSQLGSCFAFLIIMLFFKSPGLMAGYPMWLKKPKFI